MMHRFYATEDALLINFKTVVVLLHLLRCSLLPSNFFNKLQVQLAQIPWSKNVSIGTILETAGLFRCHIHLKYLISNYLGCWGYNNTILPEIMGANKLRRITNFTLTKALTSISQGSLSQLIAVKGLLTSICWKSWRVCASNYRIIRSSHLVYDFGFICWECFFGQSVVIDLVFPQRLLLTAHSTTSNYTAPLVSLLFLWSSSFPSVKGVLSLHLHDRDEIGLLRTIVLAEIKHRQDMIKRELGISGLLLISQLFTEFLMSLIRRSGIKTIFYAFATTNFD